MASPLESQCCKEMPEIVNTLKDLKAESDEMFEVLACILEHPGFDSICLDPWNLRVVYKKYQREYGKSQIPKEQNE